MVSGWVGGPWTYACLDQEHGFASQCDLETLVVFKHHGLIVSFRGLNCFHWVCCCKGKTVQGRRGKGWLPASEVLSSPKSRVVMGQGGRGHRTGKGVGVLESLCHLHNFVWGRPWVKSSWAWPMNLGRLSESRLRLPPSQHLKACRLRREAGGLRVKSDSHSHQAQNNPQSSML